jgi:release factor glutamine methyltransferase
MFLSCKKVFYADHVFHVSESVYEPSDDSFLFAENLHVKKGCYVLDMGAGCGILGIVAAENAKSVVAVDVNPYAVRCAKENARLNHVEDKMLLLQGDLFTPIKVGEKFDLIVFNAPYLPTESAESESWLEKAWSGGKNGRQTIDRFISQAPKYLKRGGSIDLMQSSLSDVGCTLEKFKEGGLETQVIAERNLPFFETVFLIEAKG